MDKKCSNKPKVMIGGQAVIEGVMMRGKTAMAIAVRNEDGDILLETERIKPKKRIGKVPVIRGIVAFVSSLVTGVNTITKSANAATSNEDEKLGAVGMFVAIFLGLVLALGVFFFVPGFVSGLIYEKLYPNVLVKNLISGFIRVALFVGYLLLVSKMKDIRRTFMYHGAEHRTINCFEKGLPLTVENVQKCSTRHNRCGTTFLFLVMVISILVFAFVDWGLVELFEKLGSGLKGTPRQLLFMAIKMLFMPFVAGLSYEVLFLFAKLPDGWFATVVRAPGLAMQRLSTKEPDDEMVEVAITSFNAVLEMDSDSGKKTVKFDDIPISTARRVINNVLEKLEVEPVEGQWMLCAVTGRKRGEVGTLEKLSLEQYNNLKKLLIKREKQPLDYCLESSCFYGRDIKVDRRVLIPRMETEILAETAIKVIKERAGGFYGGLFGGNGNFGFTGEKASDGSNCGSMMSCGGVTVLDLCTGSGCIAYTVFKETGARITASDVSDEALEVATQNLGGTGVEIVKSDMFESLAGRTFDVIVSNPPYVRTGDIEFLQREVRVQPHIALDGGEDGLYFYRIIATNAPDFLSPGGTLLLEVGFDQAEEVERMLRMTGGFRTTDIIKDLEGVNRVVLARIL